jgi:DNA topoisomerase I
MILFLVESFTKASTISKYLGKDYLVQATGGHIKDLPDNTLGVDLETLEPTFFWKRGKKKLVDRIKRVSRNAQLVLLGTDPDREGEAIAYFLWEELKKDKNIPIKRVYFYEITESALQRAIKEQTDIDINLVKAQFARRVLDRLIGYLLSPELQRDLKRRGLSVGRVQSPALRLIVEREREIQSFKSKKFYYINVLFEGFSAYSDFKFENREEAELYLKILNDALFEVKKVEEWEEIVPPPRPFNTPELQKAANEKLGFSVEKTTKLAQDLYEKGYITYPRTDAHRMNPEKAAEFLQWIEENYGIEYVGRLRKFREKAHVQSAHECIRPTSLFKKPPYGDSRKLFDLILNRTLASLSTPAIAKNTKVVLIPLTEKLSLEFIAKGRKLIFDGWTRFEDYEFREETLPKLKKGQVLKPKKIILEERQTEPPKRYTEGSLVKKLEALGIGRPSTYATIIKTLKARGYVIVEKGYLKPTDIAFSVLDYLMENFPKLVDYEYTAKMEEILDLVENGKKNWKSAVKTLFREAVDKSLSNMWLYEILSK